MKTWLILMLLSLFTLTACAAPSSASPTPTLVRLDHSALTPTLEAVAAAVPSPATSIPLPSATPTPTIAATIEPAASASPTSTPPVTAPQAEVTAAGLNVREGPGVNYPAIGTVAQGDVLDITGINGNWLQIVTTDDKQGWISGQSAYTRILGSLADVSVVEISSIDLSSPVSDLSAAVSGQPSAVTSDDRLIFATSSGGDLYLINADGTGLQKLAGGVIDPVVSPDGTQVAFTRWDGANMGALYVLNLATGAEQVVAGDMRRPKSPTWSQNGQAIIISFQHGGTVNPQPECRTFDSDDGMQLPNVSEITGTYRDSDGVTICFIRLEDLQWGLRQINLTTGQFEDLPADLYSFNPTWDPQDAARVIYDGQRGLMQLDVTTGNLQPFTEDVRDTAPVFSPDGQTLALTYKQHDHWEVYTYDLATGSRQRLTKPPLLADPQYNSAAPAWSPDSSQIAFVTDRDGSWEIWVMNADGSNQHPLFSGEVQAQLGLDYQGVNERLLNWIQ